MPEALVLDCLSLPAMRARWRDLVRKKKKKRGGAKAQKTRGKKKKNGEKAARIFRCWHSKRGAAGLSHRTCQVNQVDA